MPDRAAPVTIALTPIGWVTSPLTDPAGAPRQPDEGAPPASISITKELSGALDGLEPGAEIVVLTWLHRGDRIVLRVHPRDDPDRPETGVFVTRSPDRPNPIGLHQVTVVAIDGCRIAVDALEAVDGTPVLDIKPVLGPADGGR